MDSLLPISDRGGPAQPLLLATGLRKHFPVGGGIFGGSNSKIRRKIPGVKTDNGFTETVGSLRLPFIA